MPHGAARTRNSAHYLHLLAGSQRNNSFLVEAKFFLQPQLFVLFHNCQLNVAYSGIGFSATPCKILKIDRTNLPKKGVRSACIY
jgi:hypothetical protein